jgi:gliding motility-associated-like protein
MFDLKFKYLGGNSSLEFNFVEITNTDFCTSSRTITVEESNKAIFNNVVITEDELFVRLSIIVTVNGIGNYQYAIDLEPSEINDFSNYQDSNVFDFLLYGSHTIYINDKNGCGLIEREVHLLEFPKFITPNNDGRYDTWNINNINTTTSRFNTNSQIHIFDRFGRLLATIDPNGIGWNGTFNGKIMPEASYWFTVDIIDFKGKIFTKKGHFSLER